MQPRCHQGCRSTPDGVVLKFCRDDGLGIPIGVRSSTFLLVHVIESSEKKKKGAW